MDALTQGGHGAARPARRVFFIQLALLLYVAQLVLLGLRPYVPSWYARLHGSDLGGWNMYRYRIRSQVEAGVRGPDGAVMPFSHRSHLWHNRQLIGTPINTLSQDTLDAFARYLAGRPEVRGLAGDDATNGTVVLDVRFQRNDRPPEHLHSEWPLADD